MSLAALSPPDRLPLLTAVPWLGELLSPERRRTLEAALRVDVRHISRGPLELGRLQSASPTNVGLLLIEGVVSREVVLRGTSSAELLGPGDLIRPWDLSAGGELLDTGVRWSVVSDDARAALLDRRFAAELGAYPEVTVALIDRINARSARIATTQAISQLQRVDQRLMALFTHLAERWGRVTSDGVLLPLRLSHRMLGDLIGARRPTVSSAIGDLVRAGELVRRDDGSWLLRPEPAAQVRPALPHIEPRRSVLVTMARRGRFEPARERALG
jgi:CRP/FNR family transcriptional regulator, cyclic AMP receptor protein